MILLERNNKLQLVYLKIYVLFVKKKKLEIIKPFIYNIFLILSKRNEIFQMLKLTRPFYIYIISVV